MYNEFYHLTENPFSDSVDPRFFYASSEYEEILSTLIENVSQRRGISIVTGPAGSGKDSIAHVLAQTMGYESGLAIRLQASGGPQVLLLHLCRGLGVSCNATMSAEKLMQRAELHLLAQLSQQRSVAAVISDAECISPDTGEWVLKLARLERDGRRLLPIVLLGKPNLQERITAGEIEPLEGEVCCCRQIPPLSRDQARDYLEYRLRLANADNPSLFTADAVHLIYEESGGVPGLINRIAEQALKDAAAESAPTVDSEIVAGCIGKAMAMQLEEIFD